MVPQCRDITRIVLQSQDVALQPYVVLYHTTMQGHSQDCTSIPRCHMHTLPLCPEFYGTTMQGYSQNCTLIPRCHSLSFCPGFYGTIMQGHSQDCTSISIDIAILLCPGFYGTTMYGHSWDCTSIPRCHVHTLPHVQDSMVPQYRDILYSYVRSSMVP